MKNRRLHHHRHHHHHGGSEVAPKLRTDLAIAQNPIPFPSVGGSLGKNIIITDPDFGTKIVRATDSSSGLGNSDPLQTADGASTSIWSVGDTLLILRDTGAYGYLFQFDIATMKVTQLGKASPYQIGGQYEFSGSTPGVLYVCPYAKHLFQPAGITSANGTSVYKLTYKLVDSVWTYESCVEVCDFANILPAGFTVVWQSGLSVSQGEEVFSMSFSEGDQDTAIYGCLWRAGSGYRMINTATLEITGQWGQVGNAVLSGYVGTPPITGFTIHEISQHANPDITVISCVQLPAASELWWLNNWTLDIIGDGLGGHHCPGYVNFWSGSPGGGQWEGSPNATPTGPRLWLVPNQAGPPGLPAKQTPPQSFIGDEHASMAPFKANDETLMFAAYGPPVPSPFTSCWMGEVVAFDVTGAISGEQGTAYRVCHTYNSGLSSFFIVAGTFVCPSKTGSFAAFTSDWGGALGLTAGKQQRGDVFIVKV